MTLYGKNNNNPGNKEGNRKFLLLLGVAMKYKKKLNAVCHRAEGEVYSEENQIFKIRVLL